MFNFLKLSSSSSRVWKTIVGCYEIDYIYAEGNICIHGTRDQRVDHHFIAVILFLL